MTNALPFNPSAEDMARHINRLAGDSGNVILTDHARERMQERKITFRHIITCLRKGRVIEGPYQEPRGSWRCTMIRAVSGVEINIPVAVNFEDEVIVITVF
ncbi:MAG: DUF4258 domain-containing protein [Alphaproteobacteria bacterium]|nr:DUF4258 domain-containing protein [Alphaproteobacteria bacterium]